MNTEALNATLAQTFASDDLLVGEPMSKHTTFRCGGPAMFFVRASDAADVKAAITAAEKAETPWWIVGCGSDLLVADTGLTGVVIEIGQRMARISVEGNAIRAQAGATNEAVAQAALDAGLAGYEFASGIPGSIGGAAIMNAGAYDGEFKDVAVSVTCLFPDGEVREVSAEEADWGYRHSMMSDKGLVVLEATLQLAPGNQEDIRAKMDDLAQRRSSKQPLEMASAGSTFKRPEGILRRQAYPGRRHAGPFGRRRAGFHQACRIRREHRQRHRCRRASSHPRCASCCERAVRRNP